MNHHFREVASLSPAEHKELLASAEPQLRLYAAWTIALKRGRDFVPSAQAMLADSIPEGLRQHLVVVLAGLGERELVLTLARDDSSPVVRAVAAAHAVRTATSADDPTTLVFAREQLETGPPEVRVALLQEIAADRLAMDSDELLRFARDDDNRTVREIAIRALLRRYRTSLPDARTQIREGLTSGRDSRRSGVLSIVAREDVREFMSMLADGPLEKMIDGVNALSRRFGQLLWRELEPLTSVDDPRLVRIVLSALNAQLPGVALPWASRAYLVSRERGTSRDALDLCRIVLRIVVSTNVRVLDRRIRDALIVDVRNTLERTEPVLDSPQEDDQDDLIEEIGWLTETLDRLEKIRPQDAERKAR